MDDKSIDRTSAELTGWQQPLARLKEALAKDEFNLYCQAIGSVKDGRYAMGEVLVRMREEEAALLPPGDFFPVFEHYRMMPLLDRWVLRHTIKRLRAGSRLPRFTLNLAAQTIEDAAFPKFVGAELKAAGVAPAGIAFEIDESDALARPAACARFAGEVKAVGCGVLLDGFGRKAVTFVPLKDLRVDFVKVDGSIVRKVLRVEAECVEEPELLARLRGFGVGYVQGFGIHKPQPIDAFA